MRSLNSYRILLADNQEIFRLGLRNIFHQLDDICICGEADNNQELLKLVQKLSPDMIIMDIDLPNLTGFGPLSTTKKKNPQLKILVMTMNTRKEYISQALDIGVDGFILKEEPIGELFRAMKVIRSGGKFFSALLSSQMTSFIREGNGRPLLSMREREVLRSIAKGMKNQEIANSLSISVHTVRRYTQSIRKKLNIKHLADLIKYALTNGNC